MTGPDAASESMGEQLRSRRVALQLSQQDVADLAGVSERFVREAEHDKATLRIDKLRALLDVLGLELYLRLRSK